MNKELYNSLPEGGLYWSEAKLLWDWASKTSGKILEVGSAYVTMVALDPDGKPTRVPGLILETEEDRKRHSAALSRRHGAV